MEHRACDRITRTEMRHVLFPREDVLHQRGEINKQVRSVLARKKNKLVTCYTYNEILSNYENISDHSHFAACLLSQQTMRSAKQQEKEREVTREG